jgi:hypothetical protein
MNKSRIISILAVLSSIAATGAGVLEVVNPKYAAIAAASGALIASVTERIQGGASKPSVSAKAQKKLSSRLAR